MRRALLLFAPNYCGMAGISDKHRGAGEMLPQQLPSDVWLQIWSFLATPDVVRCQSTCKGLWSEAIQSQCLWSARYRRDFGLEVRIPRGCAAVLLGCYIPTTDCVRGVPE